MEHGCLHYQKKWDRNEERRKRGEEEKKNLALTRPRNSGRSAPSPTRESRRKVTGGGACGNFLPVSSVHTARSGGRPREVGKTLSNPLGSSLSPTFLSSNRDRHTAKPPMWSLLGPAVCLSSSELSPTWLGCLAVPNPQNHPSALLFPYITRPELVSVDMGKLPP